MRLLSTRMGSVLSAHLHKSTDVVHYGDRGQYSDHKCTRGTVVGMATTSAPRDRGRYSDHKCTGRDLVLVFHEMIIIINFFLSRGKADDR